MKKNYLIICTAALISLAIGGYAYYSDTPCPLEGTPECPKTMKCCAE